MALEGPNRPGASERIGGNATASFEVVVAELLPPRSSDDCLRAERDLERVVGTGRLAGRDFGLDRGLASGGKEAAFCQPQLGDETLKYKTRTPKSQAKMYMPINFVVLRPRSGGYGRPLTSPHP